MQRVLESRNRIADFHPEIASMRARAMKESTPPPVRERATALAATVVGQSRLQVF